MSVDQDAKHWYVLLKGKRYGPYALAALVQAVEKGVIDRDAGVWCVGWDEWRIAGEVPELFKPEAPEAEPSDSKSEDKALAPTADETEARSESESHSGKQDDAAAEPDGAQGNRPPVADAAKNRPAEDSGTKDLTGKGLTAKDLTAKDLHTTDQNTKQVETKDLGVKDLGVKDLGIKDLGIKDPAVKDLGVKDLGIKDLNVKDLGLNDLSARDPGAGDGRAAGARSLRERDSGDAGSSERGRREPGGIGFLRGRRDSGRDAGRREPSLGTPRNLDDAASETAPKKELVLPDLTARDPAVREPGLRVSRDGSREIGRDGRRKTGTAADFRAARDAPADAETAAQEPADDQTAEPEETAAVAAAKPLVPERRLSDVNLRSPLRGGDTPKDEAPAADLAAGPPIAGRGSVSAPKPAVTTAAAGTAPSARRGGGVGLAIVSVIAVLAILSGLVWAAMALGIMRVEFMPKQGQAKVGGKAPSSPSLQSLRGAGAAPALAQAPVDGIPGVVANLPAVAALKTADPDAYAKFIKRFTAVYHGEEDGDETLTRARSALRKSIKPMLAKASTESLLEVTEVNLAYMRALREGNPGSCVALSDESKGATMDSNLARDFPPLFEREMTVLQRIIANEGGKDPAPSEAEVRPFLEAVFGQLKKKPVQTQLLGHDKLTAAEYAPYCDLVIAFYEAVRALPFGDAVKLLRNLYAAAAVDPDSDLK